MTFDALVGCHATLAFRRFGAAGAFLGEITGHEGPEDPTILLLGSEIPEGAREGDTLDVFIYPDSEGRPIATTRTPRLTLGDVAFLEVTACTQFGAFVDIGLPKELLVPFSEQTTALHVGARHPIGLYRDPSGRLAGTMRVNRLLDQGAERPARGAWLAGEAWRNDPDIGLFAILERRFVGLVPASEPHGLRRGDAARFRVTAVHPDGKLELSLRGHAHEELEKDAAAILGTLIRAPGVPVNEGAPPGEIRARFGLSKKAFKRALGRLLREGAVTIADDGAVSVASRR